MKKLFGLVFLMLFLISATEMASPKTVLHPSIEGTWELVGHYNYLDGVNVSDTLPVAEGYNQIKMYHDGKVMWTRYVPNDSVEWFGYGSYEVEDGKLMEKLEFLSASMRKVAMPDMLWTMDIELKNNTFSQIFIDEEGNRINSENYKRIN